MRKEQDFLPLASAFKRTQNILAQAPEAAGEPDLAKMTDDAEKALALDYLQAKGMLDDLVAHRRYRDALSTLCQPRPPVSPATSLTCPPGARGREATSTAFLRLISDQFVRVARFSEIRG